MIQRLDFKTFKTAEEVKEWANSPEGTDYIISISFRGDLWFIFFIK